MNNYILFVFEGNRTEPQITESMRNYFIRGNTVIVSVFAGEVYQLYKDISLDLDLDTFNLIKNRRENAETLSAYTRNDFAEIYLFFDYDGQSDKADDTNLAELLEFFCEETDKGKLYVSYPMVESIKHIPQNVNFETLTVSCKENKYKSIVDACCQHKFKALKRLKASEWNTIICQHLSKMNFVVFGIFDMPQQLISQNVIFHNQCKKYINVRQEVAVLSAFPIFLHDYYGVEKLTTMLSDIVK